MYIGHNSAHCTVSHCWSPDSRLFLTSTTAPRMNVDNGFKIFKYNGIGPVIHHTWDSNDPLYYAQWHPQSVDLFPNRGQSPKRLDIDGDITTAAVSTTTPVVAAAAVVKPKAAPYRPPGSTGSLSAMLRKEETVQVGKVKPVTAGGEGGNKKPVTPVIAPRRIPGMAPPPAPAPKKGTNKHTLCTLRIDCHKGYTYVMGYVCYMYVLYIYRNKEKGETSCSFHCYPCYYSCTTCPTHIYTHCQRRRPLHYSQ